MPAGTPGDTNGATRACLDYHLDAANGTAGSNNTHCGHASGDPPCGVPASTKFCAEYGATCPNAALPLNDYDYCRAAYNATPFGTAGDTSGATQACLEYHLEAAVTAPSTHCPHAGGAAPCGVDATSTFCAAYSTICPSSTAFPNGTCATKFAALPVGVTGATSGATQACYEYHLGAALDNSATHCPHAGGAAPCTDTGVTTTAPSAANNVRSSFAIVGVITLALAYVF